MTIDKEAKRLLAGHSCENCIYMITLATIENEPEMHCNNGWSGEFVTKEHYCEEWEGDKKAAPDISWDL